MARATSRQLTQHIRDLANEAETMLDDGTVLTKAELMARLIWKSALGWADENGEVHPPATWAITLIYDRMEGKVPQAIVDETATPSAAEKVGELAREQLNRFAETTVAVPEHPGPVDGPDNGAGDTQESDEEPGLAGGPIGESGEG